MSATIIDSLAVWIGLDPTAFKKGQKDVQDGLKKTGDEAEKTQKRIDESTKKTVDAYMKIRDAVLGVAAVIVGTVAGGEFTKAITASDLAVGNLARNVNATTREVSVLEGMFRHLGSSASEADAFLETTNQILQEIRFTGTSSALSPFAMVGLDIGKFRDAATYMDRLRMLAEAASKMDPQRARYWLSQAHYSSDEINVILQGAAALEKLRKEQEQLGYTTGRDKASAVERTGAWADFERALENLSRTISTELTPGLVAAEKALTYLFSLIAHNGPAAVGIVGGLVSVIGLLKGYALVTWASQVGGSFGALGVAAGTLLGRLSLVLLTMVALYEIWKVGKGLFDWYEATHRDGIKLSPQAQARLDAGALNGVTIGAGSGSGVARGMRNNNPGNLEFAGQPGASREAGSGRFAAFGSMAEGVAALEEQLQRYGARGTDTIASIVSKYAPAGDGNNVSAYIADLVNKTGFSAGQHLNLQDADTIRSLMVALTGHEGNKVGIADINAGMALAQQRAGGGGGAVSVSIGDVHMHTTAQTMEGAGEDLGKGVRHYVLASQSQGGVN